MESPRPGRRRRTPEGATPRSPGLGPGDHACMVDDAPGRRTAVLASFAADGLDAGERVLLAVDGDVRRQLEEALAACGVDGAPAPESGDLVFVEPSRILPGAPFELSAMADRLDARIREARDGRNGVVRVGMDMGRALDAGVPVEGVIEFERTVSHCVLPGRDATALCVYPESGIAPSGLDGIVGAHPFVLAGGLASPNPLFGLEDAGWIGGGPGAWSRLQWIAPWLERAAAAEGIDSARSTSGDAHRAEAARRRHDALAALVRRLRGPLAAISVAGRRLEERAAGERREILEAARRIRRHAASLTALLDEEVTLPEDPSDAPEAPDRFDAPEASDRSDAAEASEADTAEGSTPSTADASTASTASTADAPEAAGSEAVRVLVVDDDPDSACVLRDLLEAWGHRTSLAVDGVEALEVVGRLAPDLIFLDLGLPKLDGIEVARRIRERTGDGRRPVLVAMTGWGRPEDRKRTREVGFDHHVVKPISIEQVRRLLEPAS